MKQFIAKFPKTYFAATLDMRVKLFNVLALAGAVISIYAAIAAIEDGLMNVVICLVAAVLSLWLMWFATKTQRYQLCYLITIIVIFCGLFPMLFFVGGGYDSSMPFVLLLAVLFTVFMLTGKKSLLFSFAEIIYYIGVFVAAYLRPEWVAEFDSEAQRLRDICIGFAVVAVACSVCMYLHFAMYDKQQNRLDQQNELLQNVSRSKTEFLANSSHEMRTPLTVISVNVQTATEILRETNCENPEVTQLLQNAHNEAMRLARMVEGLLTVSAMTETTERQPLCISTLLQSNADILRLSLGKRGNALVTRLEPELMVFGNADLLTQVVLNLMQNANTHTKNGTIALSARKTGTNITVSVQDTGTGIAPELLPGVFERGVSNGGTGFGLHICKTVIESHRGSIWLESEPEQGTTATFVLPCYEGQFGEEI